jgi:hypothetical protein
LRLEYEGAIYHVMSRGNRREPIFQDDVDRLLGELGWRDNTYGRREFARYMEERAGEDSEEEKTMHEGIRREWRLGPEDFLQRIGEIAGFPAERGSHLPEEVEATMEAKAERILLQELGRAKLKEEALAEMPKMHPTKARIGCRLGQETTLTLEWIASRLHAGSPSALPNAMHRWKIE